ncbi:keratin, type I cytoskeletal 19-like [Stegostoma tigrinum]|uniref:keratin, type I cytoskeletal 19-like n=1 Tax=Stegostoma tigrinum TaxID=3053191 RepID=UPI00202AE775|nr:keratin, type I cytoskeletal 19-like [Stegostoma tigrinum]
MSFIQARRSGSVILSSSRQSRASVSSSSRGRAASVYSAPTRSTRISTASSSYGTGRGSSFGSFYSGGYSSGAIGPFSINEKQTMQNLNDRLAAYLEKVRSLEKSNNQLEYQIREFYEKRTRTESKDLGSYWKTIADLRAQINDASLANARILLQIDNAKLAADDFKTKYESELAIRRGVEMDIQGLRKVLDELTLARADLESQIEGVKEEMIYTKKNHEEELKSLRHQIRGTVTVDVDSNPGIDLTKVLSEMREKYEQMAAKNQKDAEAWYKEQCASLQQTVVTNTEMLQTEKTQLTEQRRKLQGLEIEVQTLQSVKMSLEDSIQEVEDRYALELQRLQGILNDLEAELMNIHTDAQRKSQEYAQLLDDKNRLEMEIATYRRLLEGEDVRYTTDVKTENVHDPTVVTTTKVVTITETIVDGQVVESREEVNVN